MLDYLRQQVADLEQMVTEKMADDDGLDEGAVCAGPPTPSAGVGPGQDGEQRGGETLATTFLCMHRLKEESTRKSPSQQYRATDQKGADNFWFPRNIFRRWWNPTLCVKHARGP